MRLSRTILMAGVLAGAAPGLPVGLAAQTNGAMPAPAAATNTPPPAIPPMPAVRSPVDTFRQLLAMSPGDRYRALTNRSQQSRVRLIAKIREYKALDPNERELRLQATELRWFLMPLMQTPPTNRAALVDAVPPNLRPVVDRRLRQWDALPPDTQRKLLANEQAVRYLTQLGMRSPAPDNTTLGQVPLSDRLAAQVNLARLDALSEDERQRALALFQRFFEFSAEEKERALRTLSEPEREQMQRTLEEFLALPPDQRAQCVRSFEKFATMKPTERRAFLKNAQLWEAMSPAERESWRELVNTVKIQPPMPADFYNPPPPMPPPPPASSRPRVATNR